MSSENLITESLFTNVYHSIEQWHNCCAFDVICHFISRESCHRCPETRVTNTLHSNPESSIFSIFNSAPGGWSPLSEQFKVKNEVADSGQSRHSGNSGTAIATVVVRGGGSLASRRADVSGGAGHGPAGPSGGGDPSLDKGFGSLVCTAL